MYGYRSSLRWILGASMLLASVATAGSSQPLAWTWGNPTPSGNPFMTITYGAATYVAAGRDGALFTSSDGVSWLPQSGGIGVGGGYLAAAFGGGVFVLAGMDGNRKLHVESSPDGVHWSDHAFDVDADGMAGVAYDGTGFFLTTSGGSATSSDGVHWSLHGPECSPYTLGVASGLFFCGGSLGVAFSADHGQSWTTGKQYPDAIIGPGVSNGTTYFQYVDDGSAYQVYSSSDGIHWASAVTHGIPLTTGEPALWDGSRFLSLAFNAGAGRDDLYESSDGVNWVDDGGFAGVPAFHPETSWSQEVAPMGGQYVAVSYAALGIETSPDFLHWTAVTIGDDRNATTTAFNAVIHGGASYIAVGDAKAGRTAVMSSSDGLNWSSVYTTPTDLHLDTVAYGNGVFVAANDLELSDYNVSDWIYSADGVHWNPVPAPPAQALKSDLAFGHGVFVGLSSDLLTSKDGRNWTSHPLPSGMASSGGLVFDGSKFITLGESDASDHAAVYTSSDGLAWKSAGNLVLNRNAGIQRIRAVGGMLVGIGSRFFPCTTDPSSCDPEGATTPVIATSKDGIGWTAYDIGAVQDIGFRDVSFADGRYFLTGDAGLLSSSDALHWCQLLDFPESAQGIGVASDGDKLVVGGAPGALLAATVGSSTSVNCIAAGSSFAVDLSVTQETAAIGGGGSTGSSGGGGGGRSDLLILGTLLFFVLRRRSL